MFTILVSYRKEEIEKRRITDKLRFVLSIQVYKHIFSETLGSHFKAVTTFRHFKTNINWNF